MSLTLVLSLEQGGRIIRGLALPFHSPAYVIEGDDVIEEVDGRALPRPATRQGAPPAGTRSCPPSHRGRPHLGGHPRQGPGVEAELVVSDAELDSWHRRFKHGLSSGLSIGFRYDKRRTKWERPLRSGDPPRKIPRGVEIEELSLVQWPAYLRAGVTAMAIRSAADQAHHEQSQAIIAWWEREQIQRAHEQRMRAKTT